MQNSTSIRYELGIVKEDNEAFRCEVTSNAQLTKEELVLSTESEY